MKKLNFMPLCSGMNLVSSMLRFHHLVLLEVEYNNLGARSVTQWHSACLPCTGPGFDPWQMEGRRERREGKERIERGRVESNSVSFSRNLVKSSISCSGFY